MRRVEDDGRARGNQFDPGGPADVAQARGDGGVGDVEAGVAEDIEGGDGDGGVGGLVLAEYLYVKSRPAWTTRHPFSFATRSISARGPACVTPLTTGTRGLTIPAFWNAIASAVVPSCAVWSSPTDVITLTSGRQTFVLSNRPPSPTSTTATSHRR